MSKILEKIEKNGEYYSPAKRFEDFVEIFDDETKESINMPCHSAFNCVVLALKEMKHKGHISIIHKRDSLIRRDGREEVYYAEYALQNDGYVHQVARKGCYYIYAEREKA